MSEKHRRGQQGRQAWGAPRDPGYGPDQQAVIDDLERRVDQRLSGHRLKHVKGVARTALWLAQRHDVNAFEAQVAGLLHDWDKKLAPDELWEKADVCGLGIPHDERLLPLLHGWTAAASLPEQFPGLPDSVFEAVRDHTVGSVDMAPLSMAVYCADMLEPSRKGPVFEALRAASLTCTLPELFALCHRQTIAHLLAEGRYVYPGAIEVWNAWCSSVPNQP